MSAAPARVNQVYAAVGHVVGSLHWDWFNLPPRRAKTTTVVGDKSRYGLAIFRQVYNAICETDLAHLVVCYVLFFL